MDMFYHILKFQTWAKSLIHISHRNKNRFNDLLVLYILYLKIRKTTLSFILVRSIFRLFSVCRQLLCMTKFVIR